MHLAVRRGHQHAHVGADHFGGRVAEQAFRGRIDRLDDAALVDGDDGVQRGFQNGPMPRLVVAQLGLGPLAVTVMSRQASMTWTTSPASSKTGAALISSNDLVPRRVVVRVSHGHGGLRGDDLVQRAGLVAAFTGKFYARWWES